MSEHLPFTIVCTLSLLVGCLPLIGEDNVHCDQPTLRGGVWEICGQLSVKFFSEKGTQECLSVARVQCAVVVCVLFSAFVLLLVLMHGPLFCCPLVHQCGLLCCCWCLQTDVVQATVYHASVCLQHLVISH